MIERLLTLLPQLRPFPENFDMRRILIDQPWVLMQEDTTTQKFIFEKSGRVLHATNDRMKVGQWEYLSDAGSLLLHLLGTRHLLKYDFVSNGLLVLRENILSQPFVLANEQIIPNLNIEEYLGRLAEAQRDLQWLTTESGLKLQYTAAQNVEISIGAPVSVNGGAVPDGLYKIPEKNLYVGIRNSRISQKIKQVQYLTDKGLVTADTSDYGLSKGDRIHIDDVPVRDDRYVLKENMGLLYFNTSNGTVGKIWSRQDRAIMRVSILLIFAVIVLGWRCNNNHNNIKAAHKHHVIEPQRAKTAFNKTGVLPY